jgi:hypothetical protein
MTSPLLAEPSMDMQWKENSALRRVTLLIADWNPNGCSGITSQR